IDTGIGMTPALADQVFELFAQADATLARSQGGLGIGLTLARSLVELHGGSIAAHSEGPGRGSRFRVRLPVCASTAVRPSTPRIETVEVPRDLSVVLVEDNLDLLELTRDLLADAG